MEKNKFPRPKGHALNITEDSLSSVASTGDMTGLEPTPPHSDYEAESYSSLGPLPVPDSALRENENKSAH